MSTRFFTNHSEQTLFQKFRGVFESNPDIEKFDALVGYLRSSGYFALRPHLEKVPHIRILVGINVDAIMAEAINQVELWKIESNDKKPSKLPKVDASSSALIKFFRAAVDGETIPDGIPAGVSWEELEKKMTVPKQAKNVRGKLNVPRERFRQRDSGYVWAALSK